MPIAPIAPPADLKPIEEKLDALIQQVGLLGMEDVDLAPLGRRLEDVLQAVTAQGELGKPLLDKLNAIHMQLAETREQQLKPEPLIAKAVGPAVIDRPMLATGESTLPELPWGLILTGVASAAGIGIPAWGIAAWRGVRAVRRLKAMLPVQEGPAVTDFPQSPQRDTTEAKQLLRLAELEGRDPLHDAIVGRVAYDELDALIERDGPDAQFATTLKRTLEDRFNDIVPLKQTPSIVT